MSSWHSSRGTLGQALKFDHVKPADLVLGNIREKPIEKIVSSFGEFFNTIEEPCASCRWREVCGGCRAKAFYLLQDARKGDPTCLLHREPKSARFLETPKDIFSILH